MYLSGIAITLAGVFISDGSEVLQKGFFYGYTPGVCFVIRKSTLVYLVTLSLAPFTPDFLLPVTCRVTDPVPVLLWVRRGY